MDPMDISGMESFEDEEQRALHEEAEAREKRIAVRRRRVLAKIEADKRAAQGKEPTSVSHITSTMYLPPQLMNPS